LRFLDLEPVHVHDLAELNASAARATRPICWRSSSASETVESAKVHPSGALRAMRQPLPVIYLSGDGLPKIAETSGDLAWFHLERRSSSGACRPC
jgi:hypothetical protein